MTLKVFSATPTITAGAYDANDAVGGLLTFEDVCSGYANSAEIVGFVLIDKAKQDKETELWLFDREFTAMADGSAWDPSDADLAFCIGVLHIAAADYDDGADSSIAQMAQTALPHPIVLKEGGTHLYGQLVTRSTPTHASVSDLTVKLFIK